MNIAGQLDVLRAAEGHPARLALATVDLAYPSLAESTRASLREALAAAAIPHWYNGEILARLLAMPEEESAAILEKLELLSVVEPFRARGEKALNVHESSRSAIRKWMAAEQTDRFRHLSGLAADYFANDSTPSGRIEWIYHLLCADPERGADALEKFDRDWSNQARPEDRYAFAATLKELDDTKLVSGRARLWVILAVGWTRVTRGEYAVLEETAQEALALARTTGDKRAEGDAHWLLGNILMVKGHLPAACESYEKNLDISRALAEQDPGNAGWQRELATAHLGMGRIFAEQGRKKLAKDACGRGIKILERLVAQNPTHAVWQQDLAMGLKQMGDLLQAKDPKGAEKTFLAALEIARTFSENDPTNGLWKLELALAHSRVGDVLQAQEKIKEAEEEFVKACELSESLTLLDPTHGAWQMRLSVAYNRLGNILQLQQKYADAYGEFEKALAITRSFAKKNPGDAQWQREMGVALSRVGDASIGCGYIAEAQAAMAESLEIHQRLAEQDSTRIEWQRDLASAHAHSARAFRQTDPIAALAHYDEALRILVALAATDESGELGAEKNALATERAQFLEAQSDGQNQKIRPPVEQGGQSGSG